MKNLFKKVLIIMVMCIILSFGATANVFAAENELVIAQPNSSSVVANGLKVHFESYNINGNNYFKLRDLAMVLDGSDKSFEISWDATKNAIVMTNDMDYSPVGGELNVLENPTQKEAKPSTAKLYLNDEEVSLTAYNIGGNNYFKLRDIGIAMDFNVDWDAELQTITLDTTLGYGPVEPTKLLEPVEPTEPTEPAVESKLKIKSVSAISGNELKVIFENPITEAQAGEHYFSVLNSESPSYELLIGTVTIDVGQTEATFMMISKLQYLTGNELVSFDNDIYVPFDVTEDIIK